ncbi:MAG: SDR family oxidoreductase [Bacteroidia bacterium]|nr:SDR family oxidoreductase [Bacteroidia bacterium]
MTPFHLHNKTILVTGASSGIGQQIAKSICEMGGNVIITGRNNDRLQSTFNNLKGTNNKIVADLLNKNELNELIDQLPALDGIVHCAGLVQPFPIKFLSEEKINETFLTNYNIQVLLMAAITRQKKINKNASIVFISSISAAHPHKGGALYSGSKAAIESFSKVVALEFYPLSIRSNCIAPAMVKTPMYEYAEKGASKETLDEHVKKYPLGVGTVEDVANTAIFLLSDASKWITGTIITLDGGFLLGGI